MVEQYALNSEPFNLAPTVNLYFSSILLVFVSGATLLGFELAPYLDEGLQQIGTRLWSPLCETIWIFGI